MRYLETNSDRLSAIVWMESLAIHYKPFESQVNKQLIHNKVCSLGLAVSTVGDLTEIEDSLRRARRLLYGALTRG